MMIELLILILPIISLGFNVYHKLFRAEESAIAHIDYVNNYGIKRRMFHPPTRFLVLCCYILSPLYIPLGWFWMVLGIILVTGTLAVYFFSDIEITMPDPLSNEFEKLVVKRKKQTVYGTLIVLLWGVSWI